MALSCETSFSYLYSIIREGNRKIVILLETLILEIEFFDILIIIVSFKRLLLLNDSKRTVGYVFGEIHRKIIDSVTPCE